MTEEELSLIAFRMSRANEAIEEAKKETMQIWSYSKLTR